MLKFRTITRFIFILFSVTLAAMYVLRVHKYYNGIDLKQNPLQNRNISQWEINTIRKNDTRIKIVLWTGSQLLGKEYTKFMTDRLLKMRSIVNSMNEGSNEVCKSLQVSSRDERDCTFSMTQNNEVLTHADIVVFPMFNDGYTLSELPRPKYRRAEQIWVMYAREPPPISRWGNSLNNLVNWTMSYRRDSDVWTPYSRFVKLPSEHSKSSIIKFAENKTLEEWISEKSKLIFGVISNCHTDSLRERLIACMNNTGILVDVYGGCGTPFSTCGKYNENCDHVWNQFAREYKFFMAFENSLCIDYITEKFWKALNLGIVPVVYGGGNYTRDVPPGSYINVQDFSSAEHLMEYLKMLDGNATEYAKYFEWKYQYGALQDNWRFCFDHWCSLCKFAYNNKRSNQKLERKAYKNVEWWWKHEGESNKSSCISKPENIYPSWSISRSGCLTFKLNLIILPILISANFKNKNQFH